MDPMADLECDNHQVKRKTKTERSTRSSDMKDKVTDQHICKNKHYDIPFTVIYEQCCLEAQVIFLMELQMCFYNVFCIWKREGLVRFNSSETIFRKGFVSLKPDACSAFISSLDLLTVRDNIYP